MGKVNLKIDWASHEAAKYACEKWHYSKSTPVPPLVKIGVWEDKKFVGVVIFSRGASSNLLKPSSHKTNVSRIVKVAIGFLKKKSPALRLIVSFADQQYGHHGGIYQAGNWIYAGKTSKGKEFWLNGKRLHSRQVSEKGWNIQQGMKRKTAKPSECEIIETEGKHRYLMPLDKKIKKQIMCLSQPYPKRAKEAGAVEPL